MRAPHSFGILGVARQRKRGTNGKAAREDVSRFDAQRLQPGDKELVPILPAPSRSRFITCGSCSRFRIVPGCPDFGQCHAISDSAWRFRTVPSCPDFGQCLAAPILDSAWPPDFGPDESLHRGPQALRTQWSGGSVCESHERGLRPGTENVASIVGLGAACDAVSRDLEVVLARLTALRDRLWALLQADVPGLVLNGHEELRLPNTLNVRSRGPPGTPCSKGRRKSPRRRGRRAPDVVQGPRFRTVPAPDFVRCLGPSRFPDFGRCLPNFGRAWRLLAAPTRRPIAPPAGG